MGQALRPASLPQVNRVVSSAREAFPVYPEHQTYRCIATNVERGQGTKSLRDSPLRG